MGAVVTVEEDSAARVKEPTAAVGLVRLSQPRRVVAPPAAAAGWAAAAGAAAPGSS